ncbi:gas vesicle protein [Kitasatospora purpeofusca]|uniref:gas vesicle protein n=1 Tax=Kitasatospora purpeofusca TaxID=67352 RepID=UPI002A5AC49A|nr:gas vesicle protein [Kitasatospora purpeofusca]MDY0812776.1 gas vesicle protein [Kitasatospora purpeofusca]
MNGPPGTPSGAPAPQRQAALIDLLDRLLSGGVVLTGDLVLSIADIDLVRISLRALILSVSEQNPSSHMLGIPPGREPP